MSKPAPAPTPVEIEIDGKKHQGTYTVHSKMITVSGPEGLTKTTQLGGSSTQSLAALLLGELVRESRR